jgi:hypothetical protein
LSDTTPPFWGWNRGEIQGPLRATQDGIGCGHLWVPFASVTRATLHSPKNLPFAFGWRVLRLHTHDAVYDVTGRGLTGHIASLPIPVESQTSDFLPGRWRLLLGIVLVLVVIALMLLGDS